MSGFSFSELNLSGFDVSTGGVLKPGRYVCKPKELKLENTKANDGSKILTMSLQDVAGGGSIKHRINVHNRNKQATEIGRKELKNLLFYGGHSNPDFPGDISTWPELTVGVVVKEEPYTDNYGQPKTGSKVGYFVDPADVDPEHYTPKQLPAKKAGATAGGFSDDIPF